MTWPLFAALAFAVSLAGTRALVPWLRASGVVDVPGHRSSHTVPTPRGGGLAILLGAAVAAGAGAASGLAVPGPRFWCAVAAVAAVGWADDRLGGLPALGRLAVQGVAAVAAVWGTGGLGHLPLPAPLDLPLHAAALPVAVVWVVAVTNLTNFLDGIDGYAAGQGVLVALVLGVVGGAASGLGVGWALAGACLGFAVLNWHPARVFMGDVGSGTIGFAVAALPFQSAAPTPEAVFAVALAMWFFLADGTYTLLRRAARGERVLEPHRTHLYQRLVRSGLRHDQVVRAVAAPAVAVAGLGVAAVQTGSAALGWAGLGLGALGLAGMIAATRWREAAAAARAAA